MTTIVLHCIALPKCDLIQWRSLSLELELLLYSYDVASLARQCSSPVRAENSLSRVGTCSQHGRIAIGIAIGNHESQHGRITMSFRSSSLLNFIDFTAIGIAIGSPIRVYDVA